MKVAFPRISRQIMMSKLKRSHANGTNEICPSFKAKGVEVIDYQLGLQEPDSSSGLSW
jgi:hypothetical protein